MNSAGRAFNVKARRVNLFIVWLIAAAVAVVIANRFYAAGKASDCKPGQIDGQCGLSTFLGAIYGGAAGLAILGTTTVCVAVIAYRRRHPSIGREDDPLREE
jgi:hypothetical protein